MNTKIRHSLSIGALLLLVVAALLGVVALSKGPALAAPDLGPAAAPQAATLPATTCTSTGPLARTCDLWATAGTLALPGSSVTIWGYSDTAVGAAQLPGPTLIVNQGETVTVNLTNNLAEATALLFQGQNLIPDVVGAASGGTTSYTFVAGSPGTYLYEAGLTPNGQHQVAMGMFGALIVRPVDGTGTPITNQAYADAATTFDDEALLVLSEIDPNLHNSPNPAAFELRDYKPRYWLINGRAYTNTDSIPTLAGNNVLLRYVNAGLQDHSMGLLGTDQRVLAVDGSPFSYPYRVVAKTLGTGTTLDTLVSVPATAAPGTLYPLYDTSMMLHNNGAAGFGGMLTFLTIPPDGPPGDTAGPTSSALAMSPNPTDGTVDVTLSATVSDAGSGGAVVQAAEYFIDTPGANGTGVAMVATDGAFDSPTEAVSATISIADLALLSSGDHTIYVHGLDSALPTPNWGSFNIAVLSLDNAGPATGGLTLAPNPSDGGADVTMSGTADDTATGNSNIVAAEYFIDVLGADGTGTPMTVNVPAPVASVDTVIPAATMGALAEGIHPVYVHSQDAFGFWGPPATIDLQVDNTGPDTNGLTVAPNPNNGNLPINPSQFSVRVDATISDTLNFGVLSNIQSAELFIDYQGPALDPDGSGAPMTPLDSLYNSPTEAAYAFISLATINALSEGAHTIDVHGQDASGNWGAIASTVLTIDKVLPSAANPNVTPNPTGGAISATLTATAADTATNIAMAEWFEGFDPGPGNGTPMAAADGAFDSLAENLTATIDLTGWADGDYTLYVRARDAAGNWSLTVSTLLTVAGTPPPPPGPPLLYFSTLGGGAGGAVPGVPGPNDDADVYLWDSAVFARVFDARSGAGNLLPGNADIDGLTVDNTGPFPLYYVSFNRNGGTNVPGIGLVQDEDIVMYDSENGEWQLFFEGVECGLDASDGQDIDALDLDLVSGVIYFSTIGGGNGNPVVGVPGPYDDADIYAWDGAGCSRVFDARSGAGLLLPGNADIDGLRVIDADTFYMSFNRGDTTVNGLGAVQDEDVVLYDAGTWTLFFDGTALGLNVANGQDLDAVDVR